MINCLLLFYIKINTYNPHACKPQNIIWESHTYGWASQSFLLISFDFVFNFGFGNKNYHRYYLWAVSGTMHGTLWVLFIYVEYLCIRYYYYRMTLSNKWIHKMKMNYDFRELNIICFLYFSWAHGVHIFFLFFFF